MYRKINLTVQNDFGVVYRTCEAIYGRTASDLDISRAFLRYLKVTNQEETR